MCTVTFVRSEGHVFITHNRDEKTSRPGASVPQRIDAAGGTYHSPIDGLAKGTWFVVHESGDAGVLLNGGFQKHVPRPPYPASRGTVLPSVFNEVDRLAAIQNIGLVGLEPFTLLLWIDARLYKCVWDGATKHFTELDPDVPSIWSSVTLYDAEMMREKENWFRKAIAKGFSDDPQKDLIRFHTRTQSDNLEYGLTIDREGKMKTVSVTSVAIDKTQANLFYQDLGTCEVFARLIPIRSF